MLGGRARQRTTTVALAVALVALGAVVPGAPPGAWPPGAAPAAAQPPRPTPPPSPTSRPSRFFGEAMPCDVGLGLQAPAAIALRAAATVTVTAQLACANAFDGASVLVFVGGRTALNGSRLAAALGEVRRLLDTTGSPTAVLDAAALDEPVRWVETPPERHDAFDAVLQRPPDAEVAAARWTAALQTAADALAALPPSRRPLLIVVDGRRPSEAAGLVEDRLAPVARGVRDAAGRTAVIDISFDGWLADAARVIGDAGFVGLDATVDRTAAIVGDGVRQLGDRLRGAFDVATTHIQWHPHRLVTVADSASPPPTYVADDTVVWNLDRDTGPVTLRGQVAVAAIATGPTSLFASVHAEREGIIIGSGDLVHPLCVHLAGGSVADCVPTPDPAPTEPTPSSRTPSPTPPSPTPPSLTPPPRPPTATAHLPARLWLPAALR